MKTTMKKTAACLVAILMMVQIVPALADTYSSGTIVGGMEGYREALEIVASKGTYVLVGQELELDVNQGYDPSWTSADETIATIDENGVITALTPGTVTITAQDGNYSANTTVTVIDPEPIMAEAEETVAQEENQEENPTDGEPTADPTEEPIETPVVQPAEKQFMVIVINGENSRYEYDGEEHILNEFVATSNQEFFDETKIRVNGEIGVAAAECGTYEFKLEESDFSYDDPDVVASFVVNNGWMKITPAQVTVTANTLTKEIGSEDPELTATVIGLYGDDTIEFTLERMPGEKVGEYVIEAYGEEKQGNYRVNFVHGKLVIEGAPEVTVVSSIEPDQPVYAGTEIVLKAIPAGFGDVQLTYQWQRSTDGSSWEDMPGETKQTYTYIITAENYMYIYRVVVNPVD